MQQVSLREFRTRGAKALESIAPNEIVLLSGQQGPAYFLVPAFGDLALEERELRRAMTKAALRASWSAAETFGLATLSDADIDGEIDATRNARKRPQL